MEFIYVFLSGNLAIILSLILSHVTHYETIIIVDKFYATYRRYHFREVILIIDDVDLAKAVIRSLCRECNSR
jgi:hypothetical protein